MTVETCELSGVRVCRPSVYADARGRFCELSRTEAYTAAGIDMRIAQVNTSFSVAGVLRGLHYQIRHPQSKLVSCVFGSVYDVVVDCRPTSPTFGRWFGVWLTAEGGEQVFVPEGFAHGFAVTSAEGASVVYQCNDVYHPGDEGGIRWDSPALAISWPITDPILSDKDRVLPPFSAALAFPEVRRV